MAFLDRFRKKSDEDEEDSSVYRGDGESRSSLASFLFGFFALLVTLLIAAGIFFGVRALYRASHHNKNLNTTQTAKNQPSANSSNKEKSNSKPSGSSSTPSSTPSTGDNLPSTGDSLPNTGDTPQSLPKTGDPGM